MQLKLGFLESGNPTTQGWDDLDPDARRAFVHALARALAQAVRPHGHEENSKYSEDPNDR